MMEPLSFKSMNDAERHAKLSFPTFAVFPHDSSLHLPPALSQTSSTAFTHPSFSQLFVICAHRPHTTLPPAVTIPNSLTLTSTIVPFVKTPSCVYIGLCGFYLTLIIGSCTVTPSSGSDFRFVVQAHLNHPGANFTRRCIGEQNSSATR